MKVLVIGSGGREHALAWAIAASPVVDRLYCAPGNAGIAEEAECVALRPSDTAGIIEFCRHAGIDFVVVKLSGATGAQIWRKDIDGALSNDVALAVTVDGSGDVVASGFFIFSTMSAARYAASAWSSRFTLLSAA